MHSKVIDRCRTKGKTMKFLKPCLSLLAVAVVTAALAGCSARSTRTADISDSIRTSLDKAGYKDVSVNHDRDKGVVTLGGHVAADADKSQAQSIAMSIAGAEVVSNQIAVLPPGGESDARNMNSDLDNGVASNLDAALINARLHDSVKYAVKNHVVTLTGDVDSQSTRDQAQLVASAIPNVQQVVNELQVRSQKATSSN
jgi:hyperosmotically inducible periplasmic protein